MPRMARFLGRQLSRLKMAQSYYVIVTSTVTAMSVLAMAFGVGFYILIVLFPVLMAGTFAVGYFMDTRDVMTEDTLKANEVTNRYLNTADVKLQEFMILQSEAMLDALKALQDGEAIDPGALRQKYDAYIKKWAARSP